MKSVPRVWQNVPAWMTIAADAINGLLRGEKTAVSASSDYTIGEGDGVILCDATSAAFTVTLPKAAMFKGREFDVKKIDASANTITIDGDGSETIDGAATASLAAQWDRARLFSDGANWLLL